MRCNVRQQPTTLASGSLEERVTGYMHCFAPPRRPGFLVAVVLAGALVVVSAVVARANVGGDGEAERARPAPPAPEAEAPRLPAPAPGETDAGPVQSRLLPPTPGRPRIQGLLSLDGAVRAALANQPSVNRAGAEVAAAEARVGSARAMTRPTVSANTFGTLGSMGSILQSPPVAGGPQNTLAVLRGGFLDQNLMAMVPLYTGGRLGAEVRAAEARRRAAVQDLSTVGRDVTLATREAYRTAVFAAANVAVFRQDVALQEESVRIAEERLRVGSIPRLDVLRRRTELAAARQQLANVRRDADLAMIALKTTMGVSLDSPITLTDRLTLAPVGGTLESALAAARANRPEVAAAAARLQAGEAMVASAKGSYRPQVHGAGMVDLNVTSREGSTGGFTAGVVASLPLLDAGLRRSRVREAEAERERMRQEAASVDLMVAREVADAWLMQETAAGNVETARTALDEAEEGYRVMVQRYEAGRATTVEVLDALAALTRARVNEVQAVYEQNIARDRLERSTTVEPPLGAGPARSPGAPPAPTPRTGPLVPQAPTPRTAPLARPPAPEGK